jgi:hypothetical protein
MSLRQILRQSKMEAEKAKLQAQKPKKKRKTEMEAPNETQAVSTTNSDNNNATNSVPAALVKTESGTTNSAANTLNISIPSIPPPPSLSSTVEMGSVSTSTTPANPTTTSVAPQTTTSSSGSVLASSLPAASANPTTNNNSTTTNSNTNNAVSSTTNSTSTSTSTSNSNSNSPTSSTTDKTKSSASAAALEWVQCEDCKKWRTVPASIDLASLPEKWFCNMNTWNVQFNNCSAPQEEEEEDDEDTEQQQLEQQQQQEQQRLATKKRKRAKTPRATKTPRAGERTSKRSKTVVDYSKGGAGETGGINMDILNQQEQDAKERLLRKQHKQKQEAAVNRNSEYHAPALQWVQCSRCSKWRKLGIGVDANSLPEVWTCSMNTWDNIHNSCAVPQEADDTTTNNGSGGGEFVGDGQLWTGAGAYRKIGQNKYSYRMLISTAMRQTSNAMRARAQAKHANELQFSSNFVDTDSVWNELYSEAKDEVRSRRRKKGVEPGDTPVNSGAESEHDDLIGTAVTTDTNSSSNPSTVSFKGKKIRGNSIGGGQKIFSWSKIRALGQQLARGGAAKKGVKKKGGKKQAAAKKLTPADDCVIALDVVARLRDEESQCDVLMKMLGRDENAPAVEMDELMMKRNLYTILTVDDRVADYTLVSRQVLPLSGFLPSIAPLSNPITMRACRQLVADKNTLGLRLAELVRRGLVEVIRNNKETPKYKKRLISSGNNTIPFVPCATLTLKALKPWKKSFA